MAHELIAVRPYNAVRRLLIPNLFISVFTLICCLPMTAQVTLAPSITKLAGIGSAGYTGDSGPAVNAQLSAPYGAAVDSQGNVYISDTENCVIREVFANGTIPGVASPVAGDIYTIAGRGCGGPPAGDGGPAINATLNYPFHLQLDSQGNLYIPDFSELRVLYRGGTLPGVPNPMKGYIYSIAGTSTSGFGGSGGPALSAQFMELADSAIDSRGNIYLLDEFGSVWELFVSGAIPGIQTPVPGYIYLLAGNNHQGYGGDTGIAANAILNFPEGLAIDGQNNLYVGDEGNGRVRVIYSGGINVPGVTNPLPGYIYTFAGTGATTDIGVEGPALSVAIYPTALRFDAMGNLYIASDYGYLRKIDTSGNMTRIGGTGTDACGGELASQAQISPSALATDSENNVYLSEGVCNIVARVSITNLNFPPTLVGTSSPSQNAYLYLTGAETFTFATSTTTEFSQPALTGCTPQGNYPAGTVCTAAITFTPASAGLRQASLQVATSAGTVNFPMSGIGIAPQVGLSPGIITTVAGNGVDGYTGNGGVATGAELNTPVGVAWDGVNNFYISDIGDASQSAYPQIREVNAKNDIISLVVGGGVAGYAGDGGPAINALISPSYSAAADAYGHVYIADTGNSRIRGVDAETGLIVTVVGTASPGYSGDGETALNAALNSPMGVSVDQTGNFYIADTGNNAIREVTVASESPITFADGIITTIAGDGTAGYNGDNIPAATAELNTPYGTAIDRFGNVFIADTNNFRVRVIYRGGSIPNVVNPIVGNIYTIAGNGISGNGGNGSLATNTELSHIGAIAVDASENIFIADMGNYIIREVNGNTGIITAVAGNGKNGFSGDGGLAVNAQIGPVQGLAVDSAGNFYIADAANERIRLVKLNQSAFSFLTATPIGFTNSTDGPQTVTVTNTGNAPMTFVPPASGTNPSIDSNFSYNSGSTCPLLSSESSTYALVPGASCKYMVDFTPTALGSISGSMVLSTNDPNTPTALVALSGIGAQVASAMTLSSSVTSALSTQSVTLSATVTGSNTTPTGTVTFSAIPSGGTPINLGSATLSDGVATYLGRLPVGTDVASAVYSGDANFTGSTSNTVTVSVTTFTPPPPPPHPCPNSLVVSASPGIAQPICPPLR